MKFGKTLKRVLYPPWSDYYVDYKFLKGVIKKCAAALEQHINTQTSTTANYDTKDDTTRLYGLHRLEFFMWIAREVAKVSGFYERQLTEWEQQYQCMVDLEAAGVEDRQRSLDELRVLCDLLDKMRSFVLLNHLAFIKILKKYDKHVSSLTHTALSSHTLAGLLGYGPSNETGSASVSCMATIMQSAFYSSPRLAVLLTNVQVQMAVRQRGGAAVGFKREQKEEESKESGETLLYHKRGSMSDVTSSSADSAASEDDYEFLCPICLDVLSLPVILSCSHKFCFQCLANWSTQSQKCPVCRLEHPLHPDSYTVSSTLDAFLKKTYKQQGARGKDDQEASRSAERGVEDTVMATATGEYDDDEMANYADDPAAVSKPGRRSMHANPQKGVYTHSLHTHTVNSLKHINTLLDVATSNSYLVFDIDDTLLTNLYTPCLLTTDKGIQAYQAILARNPLYAELTLKQKNAVTRVLQRALDSKRLVESDTQLVIRSLQEMGCTCFGLTKRWSESSAETRKELLTMGIDFVGSSPFPRGRKYCDECTESLLVDGVIYTNGHEKGPVLDRFLSQIVFAQHLQAKKEKERTMSAGGKDATMESKELSPPAPLATNATIAPDFSVPPAQQPSSPSSRNAISSFASMLMSSIPNPFQREKSDSGASNPRSPRQSPPPPPPAAAASLTAVPSHLIFVDDLHENAHSVFHDLTLCQQLTIPIISCHYTAVKDQMEDMLKQYETQMRRDYGSPHTAGHSQSADEGSSGDESGAEDKQASPVVSAQSASTSSMALDETSAGSGSLPPLCAHSDMEILQYQVYHLVHKQQVINDQQARFIITKLKKKAQGDATGVTSKSVRRATARKDGGSREKRRSDGDEETSRPASNKAVAMDVRGSDMMELEVSQ